MKKILFALVLCLTLYSCDETPDIDKEHFINAYREILLARESIADSVAANKEVQMILTKYDYTMETFAKEYQDLMSGDSQIYGIIDSLRKEFRAKY